MIRPIRVERGPAIRWALTALCALGLCTGPLWLWGDSFRWYFLKLDDFVYLARSRSGESLARYLMTPHNGHVMPLFLVETHLLARLAGSLRALPFVLGWASYANLILAMATAGHIVAGETGSAARGLAAMAALGFSTVLGPSILWYAAGQSLAAGTPILAMLAALQAWRARGSWWWLALATLAAIAAPLFWSAGYTAGLVGLAYLWRDGRRICRLAALLPLTAGLGTAGFVWGFAGQAIASTARLSERSVSELLDLPVVLTHTTQAICEKLALNNLGLDAATSPAQSLLLCALLAGTWAWTLRRSHLRVRAHPARPNPLEAAGAVLIAASFGLIFAARGGRMTYDNLRALGWYDAVPQLGAVLFAAGWWSDGIDSPPPRSVAPPKVRELLGVALFAVVILVLQMPRAHRVIFVYDGLAAVLRSEQQGAAARRGTRVDLAAQAARQRQALAELDQIEQQARSRGHDRSVVRPNIGRLAVPGMPEALADLSAADLLNLPESAGPAIETNP